MRVTYVFDIIIENRSNNVWTKFMIKSIDKVPQIPISCTHTNKLQQQRRHK